MVMGRGSDTRVYSPRSESDKMYSSANEDETKYNPSSPEYNEQKHDEKKRKEEEKKERRSKVKHIKISSKQKLGGDESLEGLDDGNKRDDEREMGLQGGPAGSRGTLLDLATGAKSGTGSAMSPGLPIAMSEPMEDAWSELLKEDEGHRFNLNDITKTPKDTWLKQIIGFDMPTINNMVDMGLMEQLGIENHIHGDPDMMNMMVNQNVHPQESINALMEHRNSLIYLSEKLEGREHKLPSWLVDSHKDAEMTQELGGHETHPVPHIAGNLAALYTHANYLGNILGPQMQEPDEDWQNKLTSEPMEDAWSTLLKEDDVPDMSNFGAPYDPDTRIPQLSMDDLYRLLQHPNSRIRHKANEEMQMRSMDAEGSNLPFDETTPAGEVAAFYEPQFKNLKYGNQQPPSLEEGDYNEEGYDEHYSQERAGDVLDAMPGDIEFFPSLAAKYEHLKNTAPPDVVENYRNRIKDFFDNYTQPSEIFGTTLPPQFTPKLPKGTSYTPEEVMQQSDKINEALNVYPGGNRAYTGFTDIFQNKLASEPMDGAWSEILKRDTAKTIAARRRREARQQFRPSTGQFKTPPGGMSGGVGATKRRHAARMRGISSGKKTGLMKPHLSVEMSHRGIATKQPMSKDPQKYTAYRGQSEARKIQGNVRTPFSPRGRYGQRSFSAGPTGAGRLSGLLAGQRGQMRQPSLRQIGIRRPRIRRPRAPPMPSMPQMPMPQSSVPSMPAPPSSIMMSEDAQEYSDLLKARNIARRYELLNLMRRLIQAKEKEAKIKKYVQGGGSAFENGHVPDHPAGVQQHEDEDEKNDGPTQNLETNSSRLGLDPAGALISRRGSM